MPRWLADTQAIAVITGVAPGTVRSWASRGKLCRYGYDEHGRALYDAEEAERLAATPGALENAAAMCNTEPSAGVCPDTAAGTRPTGDSASSGCPPER